MVDTVWLLIPQDRITFLSDEVKFRLSRIVNRFDRYILNPTVEELMSGQYFPTVEAYPKKFYKDANVLIKFSAPKLLFLNNLDELTDKNFSQVIDTLHERLRMKDIEVDKEILRNAPVSLVHFSKNIELKNGYTSQYLISEMSKVNIRKTFDLSRTKFSNDGDGLYAHTASHEFVIYDKVSDLGKGKRRATDRDQVSGQKEMQDELIGHKKEIIRFEARLKKKKLNDFLEKLGYIKNPTFKQIFDSRLSMKIVNSYWSDLIKNGSHGIFSAHSTPDADLQSILRREKDIKPTQALYLVGLLEIVRLKGMRYLMATFSKRITYQTKYRILKDVDRATKLTKRNASAKWVAHIDRNLRRYKPYRFDPL